MFAIKFIRQFSSKMCVAKKKSEFQNHLFSRSNFPSAAILNICDVLSGRPYFFHRATTTGDNYSRWRRLGNLKNKISVFKFNLFWIQMLSLEKAILIVKTIFCGLIKVIFLFEWRCPLKTKEEIS